MSSRVRPGECHAHIVAYYCNSILVRRRWRLLRIFPLGSRRRRRIRRRRTVGHSHPVFNGQVVDGFMIVDDEPQPKPGCGSILASQLRTKCPTRVCCRFYGCLQLSWTIFRLDTSGRFGGAATPAEDSAAMEARIIDACLKLIAKLCLNNPHRLNHMVTSRPRPMYGRYVPRSAQSCRYAGTLPSSVKHSAFLRPTVAVTTLGVMSRVLLPPPLDSELPSAGHPIAARAS